MILSSQGRLPDRRPVSIIDIGSNSIRLVVYEGIARSPTVLFNEKMMAGLGRGIVATGRLDEEAVDRALEEFRRFRALSDQAGAKELHVIATAAAREAENGMEFISRAEEILGNVVRHPRMPDAGFGEAPLQRRQVSGGHGLVRHNGAGGAGRKRGDQRAGARDQALADVDVIGALAQRHMDDGVGGAHAVSPCVVVEGPREAPEPPRPR